VAASLGSPVLSSPQLTRGTNDGTFTADVVHALFTAPAGGAVAIATPDGGYLVARVSGIAHPPPPEGNLGYVRGVQQLAGEIASDITVSLAKADQKIETVTINQKLVDSTIGGNSGSGS